MSGTFVILSVLELVADRDVSDSHSQSLEDFVSGELLEILYELEILCWGELSVGRESLRTRLLNYPQGQFVAFHRVGKQSATDCRLIDKGAVMGVIYTQRTDSSSDLFPASGSIAAGDVINASNCTYYNQELLFSAAGGTAQLLSVSVQSKYASLQVGHALRLRALQHFHAVDQKEGSRLEAAGGGHCGRITNSGIGINEIIAVTRCSSINKDETMYRKNALEGNDPILQFHLLAGAKVHRLINDFRPNDVANFGFGVLVRYSLDVIVPASNLDSAAQLLSVERTSMMPINTVETLANETNAIVSPKTLLDIISSLSERIRNIELNENSLDTTFMQLGLSSLDMMQLQVLLRKEVPHELQSKVGSTVLFQYPTPRLLLKHLNNQLALPAVPMNSAAVHSSSYSDHVAIFGMSCRFPNGLNSPELFFESLLKGEDSITDAPTEWETALKGGFLSEEDANTFDHEFFGISTAECSVMDPHQKLLLVVAYEALVNANLVSNGKIVGKSGIDAVIGVFVGLSNSEWIDGSLDNITPFTSTATAQSSAANRISYTFGLEGPSVVIDTACSSSLSALHTAMNSLRCGDCDIAVVATCDLMISPNALKVCTNLLGKLLLILSC